MSMLKLTNCGFLLWIDFGKTVGVNVERTTGPVSQSDLERRFKQEVSEKPCKGLLLIFVCLIISVVLAYLTHMDLIVDFSFQKWAQQCISRVFPLSERSVCVFYIHHLFILIAQVMGSCRQMSRLQLPDVSKRKETINLNELSNFL